MPRWVSLLPSPSQVRTALAAYALEQCCPKKYNVSSYGSSDFLVPTLEKETDPLQWYLFNQSYPQITIMCNKKHTKH